jgi:hypothetical protein
VQIWGEAQQLLLLKEAVCAALLTHRDRLELDMAQLRRTYAQRNSSLPLSKHEAAGCYGA